MILLYKTSFLNQNLAHQTNDFIKVILIHHLKDFLGESRPEVFLWEFGSLPNKSLYSN